MKGRQGPKVLSLISDLSFPRPSLLRSAGRGIADLQESCKAMEAEYDKLIHLKTKGDLQGFEKILVIDVSVKAGKKRKKKGINFVPRQVGLFTQPFDANKKNE